MHGTIWLQRLNKNTETLNFDGYVNLTETPDGTKELEIFSKMSNLVDGELLHEFLWIVTGIGELELKGAQGVHMLLMVFSEADGHEIIDVQIQAKEIG